jgi:hypothetical protein
MAHEGFAHLVMSALCGDQYSISVAKEVARSGVRQRRPSNPKPVHQAAECVRMDIKNGACATRSADIPFRSPSRR